MKRSDSRDVFFEGAVSNDEILVLLLQCRILRSEENTAIGALGERRLEQY